MHGAPARTRTCAQTTHERHHLFSIFAVAFFSYANSICGPETQFLVPHLADRRGAF